jgi:hypothetical protein
MSDVATESGRARMSPRRKRTLIWVGVAVIAALVIGAIAQFGPNRNPAPETFSNQPVKVAPKKVSAKLPNEAKVVARTFIETAVARKNLGQAWDIVSPNVRGGLTKKEWMTGAIPVIPYPIQSLDKAPFKIDYSYTDEALLEVALLPKPGAGVKPQMFFLSLRKVGSAGQKRWVVDNWVPRASVMMPSGGNE